MTTQTGFLLSYLKFGDYDAVLQCFTQESGFQSFFSKGIFSSKNKNRAYLRPLNEICFTFSKKAPSGKMQLITKMDLIENPEFYNDIKCNTIVFFIAEFLKNILKNETESTQFYQEILFFLNELENKNYNAHLVFLFQSLKIMGFSPLVEQGDFLDPEKGNFTSLPTHHFFDKEVSQLWKTFITVDNPYEIKITTEQRKKILDSILVFYSVHISEFKTPKSLEIVQQILE
jgi:DNA repair protein RecO (recombination protein O)